MYFIKFWPVHYSFKRNESLFCEETAYTPPQFEFESNRAKLESVINRITNPTRIRGPGFNEPMNS